MEAKRKESLARVVEILSRRFADERSLLNDSGLVNDMIVTLGPREGLSAQSIGKARRGNGGDLVYALVADYLAKKGETIESVLSGPTKRNISSAPRVEEPVNREGIIAGYLDELRDRMHLDDKIVRNASVILMKVVGEINLAVVLEAIEAGRRIRDEIAQHEFEKSSEFASGPQLKAPPLPEIKPERRTKR